MYSFNVKKNIKKTRYLVIVVLAIISATLFHVDYYDNMDFVRHSQVMDYIRQSKISLKFFLQNADIINQNETSSNTYVFNILEYYFSNLFHNNYYFMYFLTGIDYGAIAYISYDFKRDKCYSAKEIILSIAICFSYLPFIHVVSGLRTANAMCLASLGIYLLLYHKKVIIPSLLFILALLVHSIIIIPVIIALFVFIFPFKISVLFIGFGTLLISFAVELFSKINISFISNLVLKYQRYTGERQFKGYKYSYFGALLFMFVYLFYCFIFHFFNRNKKNNQRTNSILGVTFNKCDNKNDLKSLMLFLTSYGIFVIGNYKGFEFVHRLTFLMGCFSSIISVHFIEIKTNGDKVFLALYIRVILYIVLLMMWVMNIFHYIRFFL